MEKEPFHQCKVVAEVGCCHLGQFSRAKELIQLARLCGAHYVKFQKRNPDECVPEDIKHQPHPNKIFSYGDTYLEHRKALELSIEQHKQLKEYAEDFGIGYSCSVWDETSAREVISLNPDFIKIGSPCNHNYELISLLYNEFKGDVHISLGMSSKAEIRTLIEKLPPNSAQRTVLYHCTSEYPCPFDRLYLLDIQYLIQEYGFTVGFSNHGYGIAADIAAWMLGAKWIERHFVDDRTLKHTDAAASLEPEGLRRLCRDLRHVHKAMLSKEHITDEEWAQRNKLRIP
jgi:N-acetylneuraminate synthase